MYAHIIVETASRDIDREFDYKVPENMSNLCIGMRVRVPFGKNNKNIEGYVIGLDSKTDIPDSKLKSIESICDEYPVFSNEMIELAKWMKQKYYCTLTECLQCIMPSGIDVKQNFKVEYVKLLCEIHPEQYEYLISKPKFKIQGEILKLLYQNGSMRLSDIKNELGKVDSSIRTLKKNGMIEFTYESDIYTQNSDKQYIKPTDEQQIAIDCIKNSIYNDNPDIFLIHGVTGSGKTEVYMQIIQYILQIGKQSIVLVPEISLTPQTVSRFIDRFGNRVAVTHSKMSIGERNTQWNRARRGEVDIMIGPRSAVFAPFENLGIIIVDEEHESSYKSESSPQYHAREIAQKRCELTGSKLILGSATPSVETYYRALNNEIHILTIKNRAKNNLMPDIQIVDMRKELEAGNKGIFSNVLISEIKSNIKNGQQTMLFLNRRGHSTFVSCRKCGYVVKCEDCNLPYTYHRDSSQLICHYCASKKDIPNICPQCGSKYIKYFGVGTQKVEDEIKKMFPEITVARMDMDTTSKKHSHEIILKDFADRKIDILIGTQMIAKGHDFPNVTLVGVIAADLSLNMDDFRSSEITFQLLTQVAGRAGRANLLGKVFIQTYSPESYAISYAKSQSYEQFYSQEIKMRSIMKYPPYSNIFVFLITGENENTVINSIYRLMDILKYYNRKNKFELLGPAPARLSKINKQYRWKIVIKCEEEDRLRNYAVYCADKFRTGKYCTNDIVLHLNMNPMASI